MDTNVSWKQVKALKKLGVALLKLHKVFEVSHTHKHISLIHYLVYTRMLTTQCMSKMIRRSGRAVSRLASVSTKAAGDDTGPSHAEHTDKLTRMYYAAPVNGLINKHNIKFDAKGDTTLEGFVVEEKHCHTAGSLHGSCYFKLLDDAAFFASQARVRDFFVLTSAFNTVFMRPVVPGTGSMSCAHCS